MSSEPLGILLISGGHDRAHYAFVMATAAAAIGRPVVLFATNEGCMAFAAELGEWAVYDAAVEAKGVASLSELRMAAVSFGVRMIACEAGLRLAGVTCDLMQSVEIAGVVTFLSAIGSAQVITL